MYLAIPQQPDCAQAWLAATRAVHAEANHEAYNVVIDVADPLANVARDHPVIARVETLLNAAEPSTSVFQVANTIFPQAIYAKYGAPEMFKVFDEKHLPKLKKNDRWSGYYFERMTHQRKRFDDDNHDDINPLWDLVERMRDPANKSRNKFELAIFDAERDATRSPYGGQCLSHLSFKLTDGAPRRLALTAVYRNQYYIKKLLGNLIGLGRLQGFVAKEANVAMGHLTIISTHAEVDTIGSARAVAQLIKECTDNLAPVAVPT